MSSYNIIMSMEESTVVAEYFPSPSAAAEYQSEADLEREFINLLLEQRYEYVAINSEAALIDNLRRQLEALNNIIFTDDEWERFFNKRIANSNDGIVEKTRKIQDDHIQILKRDDGSTKNIYLLDKKSIHNNRLQIINQYTENNGAQEARHDVSILVNGLPLVHIEMKRQGAAIREAFNQIKRYQRDGFVAKSGLCDYIQIFVISNGADTKYYSNTTRYAHIKEQWDSERRKSKKTSSSFEFTSHWADGNNNVIANLVDFTKTFFAKHTILNILTRYCVFTSEALLLVMRPYQIVATEQILRRIIVSTNYKKTGTVDAGGYIWHTTGSGKTLTSFKTAQLATGLDMVDKVLFVVDRKDLDYQTMKEYDRFEKGAANGSRSTKQLEKNLDNPNARIIITTIQKLDVFISQNKIHDIYKKHIVIIFDECHRSQFGGMHRKIIKAFRNYHVFGFTGTPIFAVNAGTIDTPFFKTTPQAFGDKLHTYTIVNAINDGNVLPFRYEYVSTIKQKEEIVDKSVRAIDIEKALSAPERVREVVAYIIDHFDQKTMRNSSYSIKGRSVNGFNSIFAVASIPMAMKYYKEFKKQLAEKNKDLKIATIFSYVASEDSSSDILPDEEFENDKLDKKSRDFLEAAIGDYNAMFSTTYDTSSDKFQGYYKDLSQRVKNREIDLLIVVNMFLTGFDATTLNTLWVDKNLRQHGLIQAYSRTNRILNSVKTFGNIVCFRNLERATNEAIALFGDKDATGGVLIKTYKDYYNGFDLAGEYKPGYVELITELTENFPIGKPIVGEENQKDFVRLYGTILRLKNILTAFDEFAGNEILSHSDYQNYQSDYIDIYQAMRPKDLGDKESINDDIVFELELVKQVEVNMDYILMLVEQYRESNHKDKDVISAIEKNINSSIDLRSKKELINSFVTRVSASNNIDDDWQRFVQKQKEDEIAALIASEGLKGEETRRFMEVAFRDGVLKTAGTDLDKLIPPISRFDGTGSRAEKKQNVIDKLQNFFEKYFGLT